MKRFFIAILCTTALLWTLVSCGGGSSATSVSVPDPIRFEPFTLESTTPLYFNYEKPACHISIDIEKPVDGQSSAAGLQQLLAAIPCEGALASEAQGTLEGMARAYMRQYVMQYLLDGKEAIDNYQDNPEDATTWMNYDEKVEGRVLHNADGIVCYQLSIYSYTGGAHGNQAVTQLVYDLASQRRVELSQIFAPANLPKVSELMLARLLKDNGFQTCEELAEKYSFFDPANVMPTEDFSVSVEGIRWSYAPYDMAAYTMGEVNVVLSWLELKPLMLADSPLAVMAERYE